MQGPVGCRIFSKISIIVEEANETLFWLELLHEAEIMSFEKLQSLLTEYKEVVKIVNTVRRNSKK